MTWPRVDGLRSLELGSPGKMRSRLNALVLAGRKQASPGKMRSRLNALVLAGRKQATAGVLEEYEQEGEALEHVGEHLALLDDDGQRVATVEITSVEVVPFVDVPWEFAAAEGEGHQDLEEWRAGHRRFWGSEGRHVDDDTPIVLLRLRVV